MAHLSPFVVYVSLSFTEQTSPAALILMEERLQNLSIFALQRFRTSQPNCYQQTISLSPHGRVRHGERKEISKSFQSHTAALISVPQTSAITDHEHVHWWTMQCVRSVYSSVFTGNHCTCSRLDSQADDDDDDDGLY